MSSSQSSNHTAVLTKLPYDGLLTYQRVTPKPRHTQHQVNSEDFRKCTWEEKWWGGVERKEVKSEFD